MDGILIINKEENMTSRDVVNIVSKKLNTKKVGHTGTLDPMAKGVLVIAVNKALKIVDEITALDKEYIAEVTLGIKTDTLDITGNILEKKTPRRIEKTEIEAVFQNFIGKYVMEVPIYSAVKVNGKKLYEYARNNEQVELPVKEVYINNIELFGDIIYNHDIIKFKFKCSVSKGTYIRSLIRDICKKLDEIGTMSDLIRTKQGKFKIEDSIKLDDISDNVNFISIKDSLDLPMIEVDNFLYNKVKNGSKLENRYEFDKFCFIYDNEVIAIYIVDQNDRKIVKPKKVLIG